MASASFPANTNCCLKTCKEKSLNPNDKKVHVRATYQHREAALETSEDDMLAVWDTNGEAKFHMKCWKILREAASRPNSNNQVTNETRVTDMEKLLVAVASRTVEFYNSDRTLKHEAKRVASLLKKCQHSIVFTGAGISTATGAGDYRGINGKWTNQNKTVESQAAASTTSTRRQGVILEDIRPTYTHEALVKLMDLGFVKHVISQNTDGLHRLSGIPPRQLSELHGNSFIEKCEICAKRCELRHGCRKGAADGTVPSSVCKMCKCNHRTGRRCREANCGGYMMYTTINFGDHLEDEVLSGAVAQAQMATFVLVLGSSLLVSPANSLIQMGKEPLRLAICNR